MGLKRDDRVRNEDLWKLTGMMTVNHMAVYHNLMEMFNIMKSGASESIEETLKITNRSDRITRSQTTNTVRVPRNTKNNGFTYYGAKLWNRIPEEYKTLQSASFKRAIKTWISENIPKI